MALLKMELVLRTYYKQIFQWLKAKKNKLGGKKKTTHGCHARAEPRQNDDLFCRRPHKHHSRKGSWFSFRCDKKCEILATKTTITDIQITDAKWWQQLAWLVESCEINRTRGKNNINLWPIKFMTSATIYNDILPIFTY